MVIMMLQYGHLQVKKDQLTITMSGSTESCCDNVTNGVQYCGDLSTVVVTSDNVVPNGCQL